MQKKLLIHNILKYIHKKQKILVAYSGGLDSTVLLYQLIELKKKIKLIKIRAIHINHNMNKNANNWKNHCYKECKKNKIGFITQKIKTIYKKNIEHSLREERYKIIKNNLLDNEIAVTGHHLNDQCETLLLALKRGSGPNGLSSIKEAIKFGHNKQLLIRPLISIQKKKIKKWAVEKKLKWISDTSNSNIKFERNFIRLKIIPIIEKKWPNFSKNFYRTSLICQKNEKVIHFFIKPILKMCKIDNTKIQIDKIKMYPIEVGILIIRKWIYTLIKKFISYKKVYQIYKDFILCKEHKSSKINFKKHKIQKYKNIIIYTKIAPELKNTIIFCHYPFKKITLPNNLGKLEINKHGMKIPHPKKTDLINIRFQFQGIIKIDQRNKSCKIKKIWKELKISSLYKNKIPLLFYNTTFISAIGLFIVVNKKTIKKKCWKLSWKNNI
ncbi:tRNA lysidine(34) synthetase TilS [Buchnera aphidicola (Chaitoregma tattakana)]|uniref:tRNA lysidine(34) synthetase TilS n=1 Tax=Buchnera aphidicola TaxID=9 RepID=UPI0031B8055B